MAIWEEGALILLSVSCACSRRNSQVTNYRRWIVGAEDVVEVHDLGATWPWMTSSQCWCNKYINNIKTRHSNLAMCMWHRFNFFSAMVGDVHPNMGRELQHDDMLVQRNGSSNFARLFAIVFGSKRIMSQDCGQKAGRSNSGIWQETSMVGLVRSLMVQSKSQSWRCHWNNETTLWIDGNHKALTSCNRQQQHVIRLQ